MAMVRSRRAAKAGSPFRWLDSVRSPAEALAIPGAQGRRVAVPQEVPADSKHSLHCPILPGLQQSSAITRHGSAVFGASAQAGPASRSSCTPMSRRSASARTTSSRPTSRTAMPNGLLTT